MCVMSKGQFNYLPSPDIQVHNLARRQSQRRRHIRPDDRELRKRPLWALYAKRCACAPVAKYHPTVLAGPVILIVKSGIPRIKHCFLYLLYVSNIQTDLLLEQFPATARSRKFRVLKSGYEYLAHNKINPNTINGTKTTISRNPKRYLHKLGTHSSLKTVRAALIRESKGPEGFLSNSSASHERWHGRLNILSKRSLFLVTIF